ncbi:hypothetical protein FRC04_012134 [Tulasnella sp. 424]|nr:hypothetical protein FRC04_012134 [Tulasnella sp. 424]KAG8971058.1 hypothetical protein FRC05_011524 [Tulasnella sp. 425]
MSPIQDIVKVAVQTYLQHYVAPEKASLLRADASFAAEPTKDLMIDVLEKFQSLVNEEITTQVCFMKRRRNQEHSSIYRLPPELLVEIILATDPTSRSRASFRTLMSVSRYWFDAIVQCPRIWSLVDLSAAPQARKMEMTRKLCGPVEVQCRSDPSDLDRSLTELAALTPARLRSLVCVLSPSTEALLSFFQERSSNIVDLEITANTRETLERHFDLGTDGPSLCHVEMCGVALRWTSPRLSQLRTLTLENLKEHTPSISDLYNVLTSSPALRRLRLRYIDIAGQEGPEVLTQMNRPIPLPELRHLEFYHVPGIIPSTLVPLIHSRSCQYLEVSPQGWVPWEPNGGMDLIISSAVTQATLYISISDAQNTPSVGLTSYPRVEREVWGDWDDHNTGIAVKVLACSADGPWGLFDELVSGLQAAGWNPKDLHLSWDATQNASDTDTVLLLICNFIASFPTITKLEFDLPTSLSLCSVLRFLGGGMTGMSTPLPELASIDLRQPRAFFHDQEELGNGVRSFLERRYPLYHPAAADAPPGVSPLARIFLPYFVAERLRCAWPTTSLSMEEVLNNWRPM